jgi:hypothetical protein
VRRRIAGVAVADVVMALAASVGVWVLSLVVNPLIGIDPPQPAGFLAGLALGVVCLRRQREDQDVGRGQRR